AWARDLPVVINVIAWNGWPGAAFRTPSAADVDRAVARLRAAGLRVTVRLPRGRVEAAACGQLALRGVA
ncbi:MAG: 23S rRNA (adenine(2503)-C2)-methyltransferase, partial [Deltaproteobacteria bacterium]|nr:23S rRNA (adenine(2503)-C2)-methyltransferase [Deltaproteobacteria bacterium]